MAKKTVTEKTTVEETPVVETPTVEETPVVGPIQVGHPSRDFHTPLNEENNG